MFSDEIRKELLNEIDLIYCLRDFYNQYLIPNCYKWIADILWDCHIDFVIDKNEYFELIESLLED